MTVQIKAGHPFDNEVRFSSGESALVIAGTTNVHGDYDEKPTASGKSCGPLCRYPLERRDGSKVNPQGGFRQPQEITPHSGRHHVLPHR